jgi:hypothetical protein
MTALGLRGGTDRCLATQEIPMPPIRLLATALGLAGAVVAVAQAADPPAKPEHKVGTAAIPTAPLPIQRWVDFTVVFAWDGETGAH